MTLSPRQTEILSLLLSGLRQADIARQINLTPKSVHTHIRIAADKLGIKSLRNGGHLKLIEAARAHLGAAS